MDITKTTNHTIYLLTCFILRGEHGLQAEGILVDIGGKLAGKIVVRGSFTEPVKLTLSNKHVTVTGSGTHQRTQSHILWQSEVSVSPETSFDGSIIPVQFQIPFDTQPTDTTNRSNYYQWELAALSPRGEFVATYYVPVFKTAESNFAYVQESETLAEAIPDENFKSQYFSMQSTNEGLEIRFLNNNQWKRQLVSALSERP